MMTSVMCPACQHKQLLPESEMGKLQTCPNCQSSFVAGKSAAESRGSPFPASAGQQQQQPASYSKTMLADSGAPPIKYSCPRCKAPLEAPVGQANAKINCPHCSQRHQIPAAPPPMPAAAPGLNKTMLASDERAAPPPIKFNCPNCKRPLEAPANEAGTKKNCQHCSQRYQVPAAASGLNKTKLATADEPGEWNASPSNRSAPAPGGKEQPDAKGGNTIPLTPLNLAIGFIVILLLIIVVPAVISGGKRTDNEALAQAKLELERLKLEIEAKKKDEDRQKAAESDTRRQLDDMMKQMRDREERSRAEHLKLLKDIADENKRKEMEDKFAAAQRRADEEKKESERKFQETLAELKRQREETTKALQEAKTRETKTQTVIQQPPVVYYPPYHPRYYWPWY